MRLNAPVVGMARDGSGHGYWLGAADGGVFTFGDAHFQGSATGQVPADRHVVQVVGMPDGNGYRMLALPNIADIGQMSLGASGQAVTDAQNRLMWMGYWLPGANGVFDDNMQQAVYAFQKVNGLPRTGAIDAFTQNKFRSAGRPAPRSTSGSMIEIDKARQVLFVVQNGHVNYIFNVDRFRSPVRPRRGRLLRAHARRHLLGDPPGRRSRPRAARHVVAPEVLHLVGHRGARLHVGPAVPGVARLHARLERRDELDLGEQHHADRADGLGVLRRLR